MSICAKHCARDREGNPIRKQSPGLHGVQQGEVEGVWNFPADDIRIAGTRLPSWYGRTSRDRLGFPVREQFLCWSAMLPTPSPLQSRSRSASMHKYNIKKMLATNCAKLSDSTPLSPVCSTHPSPASTSPSLSETESEIDRAGCADMCRRSCLLDSALPGS